MEAAEKISVGVIKEKTKSKAVKKEAEGMRVSTREKVCYGVGDIGANLVWTTVASFLTIYCTDVAGIAAGVVGTLMLIARLFDGVSDLFMGVIIDKTNTRWGKARPVGIMECTSACCQSDYDFYSSEYRSKRKSNLYAACIYFPCSSLFYCIKSFLQYYAFAGNNRAA